MAQKSHRTHDGAPEKGYGTEYSTASIVLDLPTDRPRILQRERRGSTEQFAMSGKVVEQLPNLDRPLAVKATLLASTVVLLTRHTAQHTAPLVVTVRSEVSEHSDTDAVLTFQLERNLSFGSLVEQAEREFPTERAHVATHSPGAPDRLARTNTDSVRQPMPLQFAVQTTSPRQPVYDETTYTQVELGTETAAPDLSLTFIITPYNVGGTLEYDVNLYEPTTARRLIYRLEHLLSEAMTAPDTPVLSLPIVPPQERALVVSSWNRTERSFPRDRATSRLFEEQVQRNPNAIAIEHEDLKVTYQELNASANQLAHRLINLGIGPDVPVGICLPRSVDMVVSVLAALKAGGAYLPLDPEQPEHRLRYIIDDARMRVVLTESARAAAFVTTSAIVLHPWPAKECRAPDEGDPIISTTAEHLAYVIYTSGSTGEPKGVAVTHRALSRLVKGADYAHLGPQETHLQLSPLTFDASLIELWGALLNGGTLVLPPSGLPFPQQLSAALERHHITTLLLVSPQLHVAAEQFPKALGQLRQLLVGGDKLSPTSAKNLLPYLGATRFIHVYGPTECTLFATWQPIRAVDTTRPTVPIGHPIANTQTYVLDQLKQPVPVGVPGELWLAGEGLAREYLGRPDLTAERFLPNPFGSPGSRMYRTGDIARWLPDGELEFLGRNDDQVKIRGHRIELGEVDAALAAHTDIQAVATVVHGNTSVGQALVSYVVGGQLPDDAQLRWFVGSRLPFYMVPAAFVRIDALPLTINGKVDHTALPAPEFGSVTPTEPSSSVDERILTAFSETLGLNVVGPDDDFFERGGNSLLLVDLLTRLQVALPDNGLTIVDLLEHRTAAAITRLLAQEATN